MAAIEIIKPFNDKENKGEKVLPGQPYKTSAERSKRLVELGFAKYKDEEKQAEVTGQTTTKKK